MTNGYDGAEDELQDRQGVLYPVGRSLRSTFPAPDGEDLQPRITSLMVELSHQPYERDPIGPANNGVAAATTPVPRKAAPSFLDGLVRMFRRRPA